MKRRIALITIAALLSCMSLALAGDNTEKKIEDIYNDTELIESSQAVDREIGKSKRIDDVVGRYIVHIKNSFPRSLTLSGLKVVVDCANGAGYKVAPTILSELGADIVVIGDKPDLAFDWSGEADALSIYFEGDADSTLLVVTPGGKIFCNDDASADNANPLVVIPDPAQGRYAIFVGRVHPEEQVKGKLTVTDAADAEPEILAPQPAPAPAPQSDQQ